jgi:hypothetical protein
LTVDVEEGRKNEAMKVIKFNKAIQQNATTKFNNKTTNFVTKKLFLQNIPQTLEKRLNFNAQA